MEIIARKNRQIVNKTGNGEGEIQIPLLIVISPTTLQGGAGLIFDP